ncbi:hydrolase [Nibricoccus sp. IMCC34717]|uniref:hydrolase n=1 Tax=Nibricoccus sp. IMCC34717 TaxID=3034021 RepID=UPI00384AF19E
MDQIPPSIAALPAQGTALRELLASWSAINSGSGHIAGLARMRAVLRGAFAEAFPKAVIEEPLLEGTEARALRVILRPEVARRVLLNGHYDTVFEADHPFQTPRFTDSETINGPGTADMKGGIVVMLAALRAFNETPEAASLGVEVLLTPDEEIGSRGSVAEIERSARRCRFGLVFEPARGGGEIVRSRMGTGSILVRVRGRSAHGAQPELGRNAIVALAEILLLADTIPERVPGALLNIGAVTGGGIINIVPDLATAELHARISKPEQKEAILGEVAKAIASVQAREGFQVDIEAAFDRPPKVCGPVEQIAFGTYNACAAAIGHPPIGWIDTGGGSDGNLLTAAGLPNLDGLGPIGLHLHSDQECVHLPSLVTRAQIAALLLQRMAAGTSGVPGLEA